MIGDITALYGDYRENESPKVVLEMQVVVMKDSPSRPTIMFRRQYGRQVALKEKSPETLVRGWNEGLQRTLTVLEEDLGSEGFKKSNVTPIPIPKQ